MLCCHRAGVDRRRRFQRGPEPIGGPFVHGLRMPAAAVRNARGGGTHRRVRARRRSRPATSRPAAGRGVRPGAGRVAPRPAARAACRASRSPPAASGTHWRAGRSAPAAAGCVRPRGRARRPSREGPRVRRTAGRSGRTRSSTSSIRDGFRSISPRESSCITRSGTRASASPLLTIVRVSSAVSGATVNSGKRAAKRASRRMRTGSSTKDGLTCRSTPASRSRLPPCGSTSCPSSPTAIALIVRSRRARSCSSVTSGDACGSNPL